VFELASCGPAALPLRIVRSNTLAADMLIPYGPTGIALVATLVHKTIGPLDDLITKRVFG